jgi:hypothetical protein
MARRAIERFAALSGNSRHGAIFGRNAARAMAFADRRAAIRAAWSELPAHACCQIYASAESGAQLREFSV